MKIFYMLFGAMFFLSGISTYSFTDIDDNTVNMSSFIGKKVLIVNTASSGDSIQFAGLETLYNTYHDSLVIIAFPSNSFGNEPLENAAIKSLMTTKYDTHFILAGKTSVTGNDQLALFQWLTQDSLNNTLSTIIQADFYKFLVDENGELMGVFSNEVLPLDSNIIKAISIPVAPVKE
ncbi:glutathione peroxidase [Panacibacter sp. DH6]|uniref:Glutathione peroxidase n=1 Tax=Panacibacter microcysteis TaxID=2793269 RepID=A0A931EBQ6_9BACT|nr:glutathione peroxidase [Panacibacter microcysteis]MBG9377716.1 glutathione peroxidase [Panacibacter microcysteis]